MEIKNMADVVASPKGGKGFTFHKEIETPTHYIYKQVNNEYGHTVGYLVFERRINTMFKCESWPGGEQFGIWAWHYSWLSQAKEKLNSLTTH